MIMLLFTMIFVCSIRNLMLAYRPTAENIIFRWQIIIGHRVEDDETIGLCPLAPGQVLHLC